MQNTSEIYAAIAAGDYWTECRVVIDGREFPEGALWSMETSLELSTGSVPIGAAVAGEIVIEMPDPGVRFPRMAKIQPFVRICNEQQQSEWLPQGVYFIDTREYRENPYGPGTLKLTGYDAMLKGEKDCPLDRSWPARDADVLGDIAKAMGVTIDSRTTALVNRSYRLQLPAGYTCREVLGFIGAMYGGSFILSDTGELRLVTAADIPRMEKLLSDEAGNPIEVGGVCILV